MAARRSTRRVVFRSLIAAAVVMLAVIPPVQAAKPTTPKQPAPPKELRAEFNGRKLPLAEVGNHYCHDFDYPVIRCFDEPIELEEDVSSDLQQMAVAALPYVIIYDETTYAGAYMFISQDYDIMLFIGWNDRVSSFKSRNLGEGTLWTDWFSGGRVYWFCCNWQVPVLYSFNDTFSSVYRD
jgi:hypothetical protein